MAFLTTSLLFFGIVGGGITLIYIAAMACAYIDDKLGFYPAAMLAIFFSSLVYGAIICVGR